MYLLLCRYDERKKDWKAYSGVVEIVIPRQVPSSTTKQQELKQIANFILCLKAIFCSACGRGPVHHCYHAFVAN
jgi:hypothetical protein